MINIYTKGNLQSFYTSYAKSVKFILDDYGISEVIPDHLGCLTHSKEEFEEATLELLKSAKQIKEIELHGRRVRVFKFEEPLNSDFPMPKIEIFEPKPDAELKNLRFGIEHIGFYVKNFDEFLNNFESKLPVAKKGQVNSSFFLKTETLNTVEIEFRSDKLGEEYE